MQDHYEAAQQILRDTNRGHGWCDYDIPNLLAALTHAVLECSDRLAGFGNSGG